MRASCSKGRERYALDATHVSKCCPSQSKAQPSARTGVAVSDFEASRFPSSIWRS